MSDRLAVFNRGRIEQVGAPAEVYERPATRVRGRVRRDLEPAQRRGRARDRRRGRARSRSGPRRSASPSPDAPVADDEIGADGTHPRASSTSARTRAIIVALDAGARARRHPAEPGDVLDGGAGPAGPGCPPDLEATARIADRRWADDGATRGGGGHDNEDRRTEICSAPWLRSRRSSAVGRARAAARGRPAPERPDADRRPLGRPARARSTSSPGPATPSGGSTDPAYDWVTPVRDGDRLQGHRQGRLGTSDEGPAHEDRRSTTASRRPATRRLRLIAGGDVAPVNTDLIPNYKDSSPASRTSRTTRSTASPTASRTAAAPTS